MVCYRWPNPAATEAICISLSQPPCRVDLSLEGPDPVLGTPNRAAQARVAAMAGVTMVATKVSSLTGENSLTATITVAPRASAWRTQAAAWRGGD